MSRFINNPQNENKNISQFFLTNLNNLPILCELTHRWLKRVFEYPYYTKLEHSDWNVICSHIQQIFILKVFQFNDYKEIYWHSL